MHGATTRGQALLKNLLHNMHVAIHLWDKQKRDLGIFQVKVMALSMIPLTNIFLTIDYCVM